MNRLTLVAGLALALAGCDRDDSATIAVVNGKRILASDFRERFEKYRAMAPEKDNIVVRKKILQNMVNESLILQDGSRQGFDSDERYRRRMDDIRDQALLDAYARSVSVDTMKVSEAALRDEFRRYNTRVSARFVYGKSRDEALALRRRLQNGETFNRIAREVFEDPKLAMTGGYLGYVKWGDTDPRLQDALYQLSPGTLSDPIKIKSGYAILRVENRFENPLVAETDYVKAKEKLEESIRAHRVVLDLESVGNQIADELSPRFNEDAVTMLLAHWSDAVLQRGEHPAPESVAGPLGDRSSMHLVRFKDRSWTVGDFLERVERTREKHRERVSTAADVKEVVEGLAIREVMLARAYGKELENTPTVLAQEEKLRTEYLLNRWTEAAEDSIRESDVRDDVVRGYYEMHESDFKSEATVNVAEILVATKEEALRLLTRSRAGEKFSALASKYTLRVWTRKSGGELGFAPASAFGDFGSKIFASRVGAVVGPEKVLDAYGLYKVLAKVPSHQKSFEEAREEIVQLLLPKRKVEAFHSALDLLRSRSNVSLNIVALGNVVVSANL